MQSARFFLKFKRSPLNMFCERQIYLKSVLQYTTAVCSVILVDTSKIRETVRQDACCNHIMKEFSCRKFSSDAPHSTGVVGVPERKGVKSHESVNVKNRNRKVSIITKSNDPDIFGDMEDFCVSDNVDLEDQIEDESEFHEDSEIFIPQDRKYRTTYDYFKGMRNFVREKKLKQALELFLEMRRHHVRPTPLHYTFMIGACGRAGYTEMAFKLLRQMTDMGFNPTPATLTGLFNSCAESPNAEYGLKKANFLKEKIPLKSWEVTRPTYHAMIKAFGKCGDIGTAFEIVDEMIKLEIRPTVDTYSALLISCVSDKDAGFAHAIEVWRKIISKRLRPNIFSYNLLLRAIRDCGIGPEEVSCNLLQHWSSYSHRLSDGQKKRLSQEDVLKLPGFLHQDIKLLSEPLGKKNVSSHQKTSSLKKEINIEYGDSSSSSKVIETVSQHSVINSDSPSHMVLNLLAPRPVSGPEFVDLENIKYPADRLLLVGGVKGVLELMRRDKVTPDVKTFTMLLKIIPDSTEDENELLALIENYRLEPDVDFFNILIKKRNYRKDFKAAKEVVVLITKNGLHPDIVTFGVLALGCTKRKDGLQLLQDMKNSGLCPNVEIFGGLLNSARKIMDFKYIHDLLKAMKIEEVKPSPKCLQILEDVRNTARQKILDLEQGKETAMLPFSEKSYNEFCEFYGQWLKSTSVEEPMDPWLQYKTEIINRVHETSYM